MQTKSIGPMEATRERKRGPKASYRDPAVPTAPFQIRGFNALLRHRIAIEALRRQVTMRELVEQILDQAIP
jgi:hypothetical protein